MQNEFFIKQHKLFLYNSYAENFFSILKIRNSIYNMYFFLSLQLFILQIVFILLFNNGIIIHLHLGIFFVSLGALICGLLNYFFLEKDNQNKLEIVHSELKIMEKSYFHDVNHFSNINLRKINQSLLRIKIMFFVYIVCNLLNYLCILFFGA